ncbi:MAG: cytochrome c maturation protein CcmE, partial [Alphaproteobacteria bacterium]
VLTAVEDSLVFFYTPSDLAERPAPPDSLFRLGGLVEAGSVRKEGATTFFNVTDLTRTIPASYTGVLPDLFREGQGVVAEGTLTADGKFTAREVLAKHDETYMPKEVAEALRKSGQWRDGEVTQ